MYDLNPVVRKCDDEEMVKHYGAYVCMLNYILTVTERYKKGRPQNDIDVFYPGILYRGLTLDDENVGIYSQLCLTGKEFRMRGMFSSSLNKDVASGYAAANVTEGKVPVVFIIQWGHARGDHFLVDGDFRYSKFQEEVSVKD